MCATSNDGAVRTEDNVGPYKDKHALVYDNFREVHLGPSAAECRACQETKRLAEREEQE